MAKNRIKNSGLVRVGAVGAVAAAAVNGVIFGIGRAADVPYVVVDGSSEETVVLAGVLIMSVATFAVGLGAAAVALRLGRPSLRTMAVIGGVLAVLSNAGFPSTEASLATKNSLAAMHLVVGAAYVISLEVVRARQQRRSQETVDDTSVTEAEAALVGA